MEPLDAMDVLAGRAAGERLPEVATDWASVMGEARVRRSRQRTWRMAAGAAVAAGVALAATGAWCEARQATVAQADPVAGMFSPMNVEMP